MSRILPYAGLLTLLDRIMRCSLGRLSSPQGANPYSRLGVMVVYPCTRRDPGSLKCSALGVRMDGLILFQHLCQCLPERAYAHSTP